MAEGTQHEEMPFKYEVVPSGNASPGTTEETASPPFGYEVVGSAPPPPIPLGWDALFGTTSGMLRGAAGMADTILTGGRPRADDPKMEVEPIPEGVDVSTYRPKFANQELLIEDGPPRMATPISDPLRAHNPHFFDYDPVTNTGDYLQTGAEFATGMLFPAGKGGMLQRALHNVVAPAVASETAGKAAQYFFPDNESAEAFARLAGAFAGGPLAGRMETGVRAFKAPKNKNTDPLIATLERNNIDLTAGNVRNDPRTLAYEATAPRTAGIFANQPVQFRDAALRKAGIAVPREGEVVMDLVEAARKNAGSTYSRVTNGLDILPSRLHTSRLRNISETYATNVEKGMQTGTIGQIQRAIENSYKSGVPIEPKQFGIWRSALSAATRSPSPIARQSAIETLRVMDDVIGRSLARAGKVDLIPLLSQARATYRDILAVENALSRAGKLGDEGMFRPTDLANALSKQGTASFMRGRRGELAELAKAGRAKLTPLEAIPPYKGSRVGLATGLAADAAAGLAGNYFGAKMFPNNPMLAYSMGPAMATATEIGRRGLGSVGRNLFASAPIQEALKRVAKNPASGASGLTGGVVGAFTGAGQQAYGGRVERKAGGRVGIDHERLADQLVGAAERAKKGISRGTEQLLDMPDDHVAHALELANRSI